MKTFLEEYGLSSIIGCIICLLVVMCTPVGGAINNNLNSTTNNLKDTGVGAQANAAKSIKNLAGEEEEIPDTIFVGYNSQNQCLVFSHSEDSPQYGDCDTKYGDKQDVIFNPGGFCPCYDLRPSSIIVENKIRPKNMTSWFVNCAFVSDYSFVSNIDTSQCTSFKNLFSQTTTTLQGISYLKNIDLSMWDTSKVTDMSRMFNSNNNLTSVNMSGWNTSSLIDVNSMFYYCNKSLQYLDFSSWDTTNVLNFNNMFYNDYSLININYGDSFVRNPNSYISNMFYKVNGNHKLNVNKPSWWTD